MLRHSLHEQYLNHNRLLIRLLITIFHPISGNLACLSELDKHRRFDLSKLAISYRVLRLSLLRFQPGCQCFNMELESLL